MPIDPYEYTEAVAEVAAQLDVKPSMSAINDALKRHKPAPAGRKTALQIDFETRSMIDLRLVGVHEYARHPSTDVIVVAWAFDRETPVCWYPGEPVPQRIVDHVLADGEIRAFNSQFERQLWWHVLTPRYGWPHAALEQFICVMAKAYALALPGDLERSAAAVGITDGKDMKGSALMLRMCKPRSIKPDGTPTWWDDAERIQRLSEYCIQDVVVQQEMDYRTIDLRPRELEVFFLDQRINDLGVYIDRNLCQQALKVVAQSAKSLNNQMGDATGWMVTAATQAGRLLEWVREQGIDVTSLAKAPLADLLARKDLPDHVREALEIRKDAAKSSTAKIAQFLARSNTDGFMRGNLQYHGAGTGRWAARGSQLQNLPKNKIKNVPQAIRSVLTGDAKIVDMVFGSPPAVVSDCLRGMISSPPGYEMFAADYSAIEARVTAWLAGQEDVLDVFRTGGDIYLHMASGIYTRTITKEDASERTIGKVAILALGFAGGVGAFAAMAAMYRVDMDSCFEPAWESASEANRNAAEKAYEDRGKSSGAGLSRNGWIAAELIKLAWRQANPKTTAMWKATGTAAMDAIRRPGTVCTAGKVSYRVAGSWLFCRLPNGRTIAYPYPKIKAQARAEFTKPDGTETNRPFRGEGQDDVDRQVAYYLKATNEAAMAAERPQDILTLKAIGRVSEVIRYKGIDPRTRKWCDQYLWVGTLVENIVQGVARDLMAEAMLRLDAAGFQIAITVHDEVVAYAPTGTRTLKEFISIMSEVPEWAEGCPISAAGWVGERYRKE